MTPASPGVKLTYDDFVLFPDDGMRHELIDGEHYVTPSPNTKHQSVSGNLTCSSAPGSSTTRLAGSFTRRSTSCSPIFDVVEPDLLYLSNARAAER